MKTMRNLAFAFAACLLAAPMLGAQDLSKYRSFTLGTRIPAVLKATDQLAPDVKTLHGGSALLQELTWWPTTVLWGSHPIDNVEQILFSFYNGELYKMSVTYNRKATEGLTPDDMVNSISAKYGPPKRVALAIDFISDHRYDAGGKPVASWEDSEYSLNLVQSFFSGDFQLVLFSKRANATAEAALADALELDKQQGPQREAARQKKEADELEAARQKNRKTFRP